MFQVRPASLWPFGRGAEVEQGMIRLQSVEIHDIETSPEKRTRTLKHLLRANHVNHSLLYCHLQFHNHMSHILGSAYLLGATPEQLVEDYDAEAGELEAWQDSPGEVSRHDWIDYLGKKQYQRAFVDFFEDELVRFGYDWRQLVGEYVFGGKRPLASSLLCGLGHPLIHLSYAYELSNHTLAIEALTTTATCHDPNLSKYLDDPAYDRPATAPSHSLLELLERVRTDGRLDDVATSMAASVSVSASPLASHAAVLLEHWNNWAPLDAADSATAAFLDSQRAAVLLLVGTSRTLAEGQGRNPVYNFFLVHVLTTNHALRVLLPLVRTPRLQRQLLRAWWLFALTTYVAQRRPAIDQSLLLLARDDPVEDATTTTTTTQTWARLTDDALHGRHRTDAHFVKAVRAMREAEKTLPGGDGDGDGQEDGAGGEKKAKESYLRAATRFVDEFTAWSYGPQ
ncbi:MAG: hypothetical protein M1826_003591 [Phylliscum demangeonii]|nr:MAG: hypothetical protein M1826_003591 [Phylliscum demangeonii]